MLHGIDVSSNNPDLTPSKLPQVQFCIVKATEGLGYVDPPCDYVVQDCIAHDIPWGFYHYGRNNEPTVEARFFIENTRNYFGNGIPVLDWEEDQSVNWINTFARVVYEETGIRPWIYANPWRFNQGGVDPECARWIAAYPDVVRPSIDFDPGNPPETDGLVACWQFASDGVVNGYNGNLDVNVFYGDRAAWNAYATGGKVKIPDKNVNILEDSDYKITVERK